MTYTASQIRHAGLHWPENAGGEHPSREAILAYPGMQGAVLICSPSARYHYGAIRENAPYAVVVWRAIPRQGRLPAQLGWEPNRVADEVLNLWSEQAHGGVEWFLPLNELQFTKEAGEEFSGYARLAEHLGRLRLQLRRKFNQMGLPGVRLMFPAWVPQDDGDKLHEWLTEAMQWDAVCVHCYGDAETMHERYRAYRAAVGPVMPLFVGEWNANHTGADERTALQMWAEVAATDPAFAGATYYIYETNNEGEQDLSIRKEHHRVELFSNPPVYEEQPVEPDLRQLAYDAAVSAGIDPDTFVKQIQQESSFDPLAHNATSDASGIAQIIPFWHPKKLGWDPSTDVWITEKALAYAANLMSDHLRYYSGDWALALSAYNAGRGATERGRAGELDNWPDPETVTYVSNILDLPTGEAKRRLTGSSAPTTDLLYGPDVPDAISRQTDNWSCSVRSTAAALWAMHAVGHGPPVAYDDVYTRLVPGVANSDVGLKLGSGVDLAATLRAMGYEASNRTSVSLADVQALAGKQPVLIGGHGWGPAGHWAYVRGVEPDGTLILENPAGTYDRISDRLRDSWERLGPWSMVKIDVPDRPNHAEMAKIEELQARVAALEDGVSSLERALAEATVERDAALAARNSLVEGLAVAADDHGDAIQQALDAIRRIRAERVGVRP